MKTEIKGDGVIKNNLSDTFFSVKGRRCHPDIFQIQLIECFGEFTVPPALTVVPAGTNCVFLVI